MSNDEVVTRLSPYFPNCPYPTLLSAVEQTYSEMEAMRIEYPEEFPQALEYGAKWRLYGMRSGRWYDLSEADRHRGLYSDARHKAKLAEDCANDDYTGYSSVPNF